MELIDRKTVFAFSILDGIYWAFYASFVGFIATYLLACGLSNATLSLMLAVFMGLSFVGAFFWGSCCDRAKSNKKVFIPEFIAAVIVSLIIFFIAKSHLMLAVCLYPVFGFLSAPLGSNLDAWMLRSFHRDAATYGRARAVGSSGYAIMALFMGQLIAKFGYDMIPFGVVATSAVVISIALALKELPMEEHHAVKEQESLNPLQLFSIRPYIFMIAIIFLTGLSISPINNLKIVILQSVGGDVGILGIDSFIGVMVQAVFIFMSGRLRALPVYLRLFLVSVCVMITQILTFTAVSPVMIIMGTVINNVSYGLMLPTTREITEANVSGSLKNTAHAISDAMYGSFAGIIALLYSGVLMDAFGARFIALIGMCIMIVPVLLSLVAMLKHVKK